MTVWAGIDEAGYGPTLGPLVVAGTAFRMDRQPKEGLLWTLLREAVTKHARGSAGRLVVYDSKKVYTPSQGLKRLEEGVLSFLQTHEAARQWQHPGSPTPSELFRLLAGGRAARGGRTRGGGPVSDSEMPPWYRAIARTALPVASNASAVLSQAADLEQACGQAGVRLIAARATAVFPPEYNRIVALTRNKAMLLFQRCGLILQELRAAAGDEDCYVLVDKHGGRSRYRKLLRDVFPDGECDVLQEDDDGSVYRITDGGRGAERRLWVGFKEKGDTKALPTALASMTAKYMRELYMGAFNAYWCARLDGLKPTAGYATDARRFLRDVAPALAAAGVDVERIVRRS